MNEDLMREAGFGGGFTTYKNLTVDNGKDILGTGATGDFVESEWNSETKEKIKKSFGKEFEGVILLSRVIVSKNITDTNRNTKKMWESDEFNPLMNKKRDGAKALIPIYQFDFNGQRLKTPQGKYDVRYTFYEDLSVQKKQGNPAADYTYTIILYVLVFNEETGQKEVVKLRFKGKSRGNFFKYQQELWKNFRMKSAEVFTKFSVYLEKSYSKFAISFAPILQEDGQPKKHSDMGEIEMEIAALLASSAQRRQNFIAPTNNTQFLLTTTTTTQQVITPEEESSFPVIDEGEVKMEDIPY